MLPSLQLLAQIPQRILNIPNQRKESKRREHYGLFLLCYEAGLRVSEAANFDLNSKTKKGLFRITKTKGRKERLAYIPQKVIRELKKHDWKPQQTNRFNFYHFLRKIKRELNLPPNTELTPHTLRRAFATYHAENGLPLPLLSKLLGHKSVRTTALYWMNIYNDDGNDPADLLTAKFWPKRPKPPRPESESPVNLNLDQLPEISMKNFPQPLASELPPKYLGKIRQLEEKLTQIQSEKDQKIKDLTAEKETLQQDLRNSDEQNAILQQNLSEKDQIIKELEQRLTAEQEKRTVAENNLSQEREISHTQKQTINNLHQQLQAERKINTDLANKIHAYEQNYINLQNTYQNAIKDKESTQNQANYYETQLKSIAQTLYRWQKISCYQQLEKSQLQAQILQREPPPWKNK